MATLLLESQTVHVDDSFLKLSPTDQDQTVNEIARNIGLLPGSATTTGALPQGMHRFLITDAKIGAVYEVTAPDQVSAYSAYQSLFGEGAKVATPPLPPGFQVEIPVTTGEQALGEFLGNAAYPALFSLGVAILVFFVGRAVRYILTGPNPQN